MDFKEKVRNLIDLNKLDYKFINPPILVSGMAMMYHGLRESTKDIDFIISKEDHKNLGLKFANDAILLDGDSKSGYKEKPEFVDLYEDHGILIYEFEIWDSIYQFDYDLLKFEAISEKDFLVISLEKLLMLSFVRGLRNERYMEDAKLIGLRIEKNFYDGIKPQKNKYWSDLLKS